MIGRYNINIKNTLDYILVYLLISLSGNFAFGKAALVLTFLVSFIIFLYRRKSIDLIFLYFIFTLSIISLLQMLKFNFYPWVTLLGLYIRVLLAYFIIKSVGPTFIKKFVIIMVVISVISLIFFLLMNIIPGFINYTKPFAFVIQEDMIGDNWKLQMAYYTGIHTFKFMPYDTHFGFTRNPGPFWETGAFGGYLMIALIFNTLRTGQLFNKNGIIITIAIFTTVATTIYIAFAVLVFFYLLAHKKYKILKWPLALVVSIVGVFLFTYLDFLGAKVENRINIALNPGVIYTTKGSRFGDAVRDFYAFQGHELIGRGMNEETRLSKIDKQTGYIMRTNEMSNHLVTFGSIFFILTFVLLFRSFYGVNNYYHNLHNSFILYVIVVLILLLQAQTYFRFPLFWGLLFLYSMYMNSQKEDDALYSNTRIQ